MNEIIFDKIKHVDDAGVEFWLARELQEVLGYKEWRNFKKVIDTAKIACKISENEVNDHFVEVNKMVEIGSKTSRQAWRISTSQKKHKNTSKRA